MKKQKHSKIVLIRLTPHESAELKTAIDRLSKFTNIYTTAGYFRWLHARCGIPLSNLEVPIGNLNLFDEDKRKEIIGRSTT